jgi:glyoxylase-like metal-dependent hydrolase (beta-lactamase superfamily II)
MTLQRGGQPYPWQEDPEWQKWHEAARDDSQTLRADNLVIHSYQSGFDPYLTSSYYFETERGVVLVDTQLFYSAVVELWEEIQRNTSGNLYCIVNTHAHPDHYYGNAYLKKVAPGALVVSSRAVMEDLKRTYEVRCAKTNFDWGEEVFDDPGKIVLPNLLFDEQATLEFDNVTLELRDMGPSEAPVQLVGWIPQVRGIIAADILQNQQHLYFVDRTLAPWYRLLQEFETWKPEYVLTGHQGIARADDLIPETKRWIATYLGLMAESLPSGADIEDVDALDDDGRDRVLRGMREAFPNWFDPYFHDGWTVMETCFAGARSEVVGAAIADHGRYKED